MGTTFRGRERERLPRRDRIERRHFGESGRTPTNGG
jgi:hypothetical protein